MLFIVIVSNFSVNDLRVTPYEMWFSLLVPVSKFRWILFPTFRNHGEFFYMSADIRLSSLLVYWFFVFWKIYFFYWNKKQNLKIINKIHLGLFWNYLHSFAVKKMFLWEIMLTLTSLWESWHCCKILLTLNVSIIINRF